MNDRRKLFDDQADRYDGFVGSGPFPLAEYDEMLDRLVRMAAVQPGERVLDVGVGTGNLSQRIHARGCEIWGIDFSPRMLDRARSKLPTAHLVCADLLDGWPPEVSGTFDAILSAYVFHEFDTAGKLRVIAQLSEHLAGGGRLLIGDVAFETGAELSAARQTYAKWWEDEDYWVAERDLPRLTERGFDASFHRVSFSGGIFRIAPRRSGASPETDCGVDRSPPNP